MREDLLISATTSRESSHETSCTKHHLSKSRLVPANVSRSFQLHHCFDVIVLVRCGMTPRSCLLDFIFPHIVLVRGSRRDQDGSALVPSTSLQTHQHRSCPPLCTSHIQTGSLAQHFQFIGSSNILHEHVIALGSPLSSMTRSFLRCGSAYSVPLTNAWHHDWNASQRVLIFLDLGWFT